MNEQPRVFVVATDETGRYDDAVRKAATMAAEQQAKVILYDVSAPGSAFSDPRPNIWAGEGEREQYDHPLDPVALEHLGRHALALQVQSARQAGADAYGWLPEKDGADALAQYAARQHASLVLLPMDLDVPEIEKVEQAHNGVKVERV